MFLILFSALILLGDLKLLSFFLILFNVYVAYSFLKDIPYFLLSLFVGYCNYSIAMGEYIFGVSIAPDTGARTDHAEAIGLYGLVVFNFLFFWVLNKNKSYHSLTMTNLDYSIGKNHFLFFILLFSVIFFIYIGIDWRRTEVYQVRISPIFEYSILLILIASFYARKDRVLAMFFVVVVLLFILADAINGGRVSSTQVLILCALVFSDKLFFIRNTKFLIPLMFFGAFFMKLLGTLRNSPDFSGTSLQVLSDSFLRNFFVFDTATFSYYAGLTMIEATNFIEWPYRIFNFVSWIFYVFFGSLLHEHEHTSAYVSLNYFVNFGGGGISSYFYFWGGWFGVIIGSLTVAFFITYLRKRATSNKIFLGLFILSIATVPRWYLYAPNSLFRPMLFLLFIMAALNMLNYLSKR